MIKVGLRGENYPTDEGKDVLLSHIVEYYGNHTHEEIKLAFELAITGRLEFTEKQDSKHYENFSCEYFSRIMNAYRTWAAKTYKEVVKPKPPEPEKEDLNDKTMQDWWNDVSNRVRNQGMSYLFISTQLYDWAFGKGLVQDSGISKSEIFKQTVDKHIEELTEKYRSEQSIQVKKELEDFLRMKKFSLVEAYYAEMVKTLSKRLMVFVMMKNEPNEAHQD